MNKRLKKRLLPIAVVVVAAAGAWLMVFTRPQPHKGDPVPISPIVMVMPVEEGDAESVIRALGTVKAVQEVQIRPRVTGTVIAMNESLQPGGFMIEGDVLLKLDPTDYDLEFRRKQSDVARARADLELEMGQQNVARSEFEQLRRTLPDLPGFSSSLQSSALALREPHLAQARANLTSAETELEIARVNLERTTLKAPFNALVISRSASLGSQASTSDVLATLVNTDAFWVEATVPLDRLQALRTRGNEALAVTVHMSGGGMRNGTVERLTGTLDANSRMGQVLVTIKDPLGLAVEDPDIIPLVLNDQVEVSISLGRQSGLSVLPRAALRGGDRVWIAADGRLDIREIDILWRDTDHVYVRSGLKPGELVVVSDLAAPIQNMSIRLPTGYASPPATASAPAENVESDS